MPGESHTADGGHGPAETPHALTVEEIKKTVEVGILWPCLRPLLESDLFNGSWNNKSPPESYVAVFARTIAEARRMPSERALTVSRFMVSFAEMHDELLFILFHPGNPSCLTGANGYLPDQFLQSCSNQV